MKNRYAPLVIAIFLGITSLYAQTSCTDRNGYVASKDTGTYGYFTLDRGYQEKASETYHYSGPGKVSSVRIYGNCPTAVEGGVALQIGIYNVDVNGRPTSLLKSSNVTWFWNQNANGYMDVFFPEGGVTVNNNFAVEVELRNGWPWGTSFKLRYTGNGEGRGEDLASIAGTSTGFNWTSAKNDFGMDGDLYLVPNMTNFITANFTSSNICVATGGQVSFTNTSTVSLDSVFNRLAATSYNGGANLYSWNFGDGSAISHTKNPTHNFSTPGLYTVSLTTSLVGWHNTCSDIKRMQVSVGLTESVASVVNPTCFGLGNGSATFSANGGAGNYWYSIDGINFQHATTFTSMPAGNYTLYVKDDIGCSGTQEFSLTQPGALAFNLPQTTNASCGSATGGILVSAAGGIGTLTYKIGEGQYQPGGSFTGLVAGGYTVTVKDSNNCTASASVAVNDAGGPTLSLTSMTNVSCNGASDGSIVLSATGGSGVLQYSIDGGTHFQSNGSFTGLVSGLYTAIVKDAGGCKQGLTITINQPPALNFAAAAAPASCFNGTDGSINITSAIGGTGAFSYSINGTSYQSGVLFSSLTAGVYIVYVKDAEGCVKHTSVSVLQPSAVSATVSATPAICNGSYNGSISISASGGINGYNYSIDGENYQEVGTFTELAAGTYSITITDANGCAYVTSQSVTQPTPVEATITTTTSTCGNSNGGMLVEATGGSGSGYLYSVSSADFNSTGSFSNLAAGTYYVLVADANGCGNLFQAAIADANGPVIGNSTHTNVSCNQGDDGTITISNVSGGTGTLQYSVNGASWQASPVFNNLTAGVYSVLVKDANGCRGSVADTLTQPAPFVITATTQNLRCYKDRSGSVTVFAGGGSGVYAYSIDNGGFQSSNVFSGLASGIHLVDIRDAAGCTGRIYFGLTQPDQLKISTGVLNVSCNGAHNGAIIIMPTGGTGHYTYSLDDNEGYQQANSFGGLSGGEHTVYVSDSSGCISSTPVYVNEPSPLTVVPTFSNVSCAGGNDGSISLNVYGGTQPYQYAWSTEETTQDLFNLTGGSYSLIVKDGHGCTVVEEYNITEPAEPLIINGVVNNATGAANNNGSVRTTTTGGNPPYTYTWSNGQTTRDINGLAPGTYTVNVKDQNNCIATGIFTVTNTTGIYQVNGKNFDISIYPNPSSGLATIEAAGASIDNIKVISVIGEVVYDQKVQSYKTTLNLSQMASGIYFVKLEIEGKTVTQRLILSR